MSTLYSTGASLGPLYSGLAVGYRQVGLDGTVVVPFTTAGVAETTIPGNYTVAGGMPVPVAPARIVWGTAGQDLGEEIFAGVVSAPASYPVLVSLGPLYAGLAVGYRLVDASGVVAAFTTAGVAETTEPGDYAVVVPLPAGFTGRVVYGTAGADLAEEWVQTGPGVSGAATFEAALKAYLLSNLTSLTDCFLDETSDNPGPGPYAILSPLNETPAWTTDPAYFPADYNVQLSFVGQGSGTVRALRDAAYRLLTPRHAAGSGTPANAPLTFGDGGMPAFGSLPGMKRQIRQQKKGPDGQPVWVFLFDCRFYLTRPQ